MEVIINKKKTRSENLDMISNLPDSLLIDILALLDPRDAAQTCILSKRWSNLWAFVPSLSFDMEKFKGKADNFNNFVSSFLRLRDKASDVHKFALRYAVSLETKFSDLVIWAWIMYASEHKVKNLVVHLVGWPCHFLSNKSRFHCDTLVNLHLCGIVLMEADDLCLPKLKTLSLIDVIAHGESMQKLQSGCPALITLIMCYSTMYTSNISFGSIKSLTIECCTLGSSLPFSISAPCVEYLEFVEGKGARIITFNDMSRVTKAIIGGLGEPGRTAHSFRLLDAIKGVQDLEFTCIYLEVLYLNRELLKCGIFNKLKNLRLGFGCPCQDYSTLLSSFLKHCPNLEYLCLLHDKDFCDCEERHGEMFSKIGHKQYEGFLGRYLKLVTFDSRTLCQQNLLPRMEKAFLQWNKEG